MMKFSILKLQNSSDIMPQLRDGLAAIDVNHAFKLIFYHHNSQWIKKADHCAHKANEYNH